MKKLLIFGTILSCLMPISSFSSSRAVCSNTEAPKSYYRCCFESTRIYKTMWYRFDNENDSCGNQKLKDRASCNKDTDIRGPSYLEKMKEGCQYQ